MGTKEELREIEKLLDKFNATDAEFPLSYRVKGLIERYKALAELYENLRDDYNAIDDQLIECLGS